MNVDNGAKRLLDSYHSLSELISRLSEFSGPKVNRKELADIIQSRLKEYETNIESLEIQMEDEPDGYVKSNYYVVLDRLKENLRLARGRFRTAQFESIKSAELKWKNERDRLFGNRSEDNKEKDTNRPLGDQMVEKSEDITATLRHLHQLAQAEVGKSALNIEELDLSTKQLRELEQKYSAFDVILNGSKRLVRHIEEADKWDRIYMLASLSFLGAVILWILWRRIFKGPVMLLMWFILSFLRLVTPRQRNSLAVSTTVEGALKATLNTGLSATLNATSTIVSTPSAVASTTVVLHDDL
jgi:protein transport protein SEC20